MIKYWKIISWRHMADKVHVLYGDDDEMMRQVIGGQLAKRGYEVIYAVDGNQARDMARRFLPQLVLLDYRMPIFDGLTTAKYLKSEEPTKNIPVMLLTNEDISIEGKKMWSEHGVDGFIHKSADIDVFFKQIEEVLTKYKIAIPAPQKPGAAKDE
jgi:DNA-binding response OmpR family regulator